MRGGRHRNRRIAAYRLVAAVRPAQALERGAGHSSKLFCPRGAVVEQLSCSRWWTQLRSQRDEERGGGRGARTAAGGRQPRGVGFDRTQAAQQGSTLDDNLMVWVRRLIDEDANIFAGTELQATSERTVFASGLLSSRTPADVYGALALRREGGTVARERIGDFEYVVAAAPIRLGTIDAMMTVPLPHVSATSTPR